MRWPALVSYCEECYLGMGNNAAELWILAPLISKQLIGASGIDHRKTNHRTFAFCLKISRSLLCDKEIGNYNLIVACIIELH